MLKSLLALLHQILLHSHLEFMSNFSYLPNYFEEKNIIFRLMSLPSLVQDIAVLSGTGSI